MRIKLIEILTVCDISFLTTVPDKSLPWLFIFLEIDIY